MKDNMNKKKEKWRPFKRLFKRTTCSPPSIPSTPPQPPPQTPTPAVECFETEEGEILVIEIDQVQDDEEEQEGKWVEEGESDVDVSADVGVIIDPPERYEFENQEKLVFVIEPTLKEFGIFGLDDDATDLELKKSYRELIKEHHPDNGGEPKMFIKIQKAYEKILQYRSIEL